METIFIHAHSTIHLNVVKSALIKFPSKTGGNPWVFFRLLLVGCSALLVSTIWNCAAPPLLKSAALKSWKPTVFDHGVRTPQLITARVNTSATWQLTWHVCCNGSACGRHDHTFLHKPSLTRRDIVLPKTFAQILPIVEQLSKNPHMHCTSHHVGRPQPTSVCLAQIPFQSNWLNIGFLNRCKAHTCRFIGA